MLIKKIASYTNYTGLIRYQHKFYYWGSQGFVKRGQRGPKAKKGGAWPFSELDCPIYLLYTLVIFREVG